MAQAAAASETVGTPVVPQKKRTRPNPARRKASKLNARSEPESAKASLPPIKPLPPSATGAVQQPPKSTSSGKQQQSLTRAHPARSRPEPQSSGSQNDGNDISGTLALATPAMISGGLLGCVAGAAIVMGAGIWKNLGGVDSAILAARTAKLTTNNLVEEVITSMKAGTYCTPEALDMLRRTTLAYASTIPGGAPLVERIFREVDMIRKQRGQEVDKVIQQTYRDLSEANTRGANSTEMQVIIVQNLAHLSKFAGHAAQDVLDRNPQLKPLTSNAIKSLRPLPEPKVPTVKLNMAIRHKPYATA